MAKLRKPPPVPKVSFTVRDPIFHRKVHVLLNYTADDFTAWAHRKGDKTYERDGRADANFYAFSSAMGDDTEPDEWIICMKQFNWCITDQGSLIHEIVHTVMKIFAMNNIPFNHDTQEFIASMVGSLYEEIASKIRRYI